MKKSKSKSSGTPKIDPYLEGVVSKLLERLIILEKKMDVVIGQTSGKGAVGSGQAKGSVGSVDIKKPSYPSRVLYEAICADCHKVCEVPFRPSEDRPVYCKECFSKRKSGGGTPPNKPAFGLIPVAASSKTPSKPPIAQPVSAAIFDPPKKEKKSVSSKKSKKKK